MTRDEAMQAKIAILEQNLYELEKKIEECRELKEIPWKLRYGAAQDLFKNATSILVISAAMVELEATVNLDPDKNN